MNAVTGRMSELLGVKIDVVSLRIEVKECFPFGVTAACVPFKVSYQMFSLSTVASFIARTLWTKPLNLQR